MMVYKAPVIIEKHHVDEIESYLSDGGDTIDYEECVSMSIEVYVLLYPVLEEYKPKEINTKEIKKVTRNYYYNELWDGYNG